MAANWKMYKTPVQAEDYEKAFRRSSPNSSATIVICPSAHRDTRSSPLSTGTHIPIGAQNLYWAKEAAYTGETSARDAESDRRDLRDHRPQRTPTVLRRNRRSVNKKLATALERGSRPSTASERVLDEREAGRTDSPRNPMSLALVGIVPDDAENIVVAYEPIWAIGTGKTATPEIAASAHLLIRSEIARRLGRHVADSVRILYGGSVKPDNAIALLNQPEIDGALVGGASLDPQSFAKIVKY